MAQHSRTDPAELDRSGGRQDQEEPRHEKDRRQGQHELHKKGQLNQEHSEHINNADVDKSGNLKR